MHADGTQATTPDQISKIELKHFADIEAAQIMTYQELCSKYNHLDPPDGYSADIRDAMTKVELSASFAAASAKRKSSQVRTKSRMRSCHLLLLLPLGMLIRC